MAVQTKNNEQKIAQKNYDDVIAKACSLRDQYDKQSQLRTAAHQASSLATETASVPLLVEGVPPVPSGADIPSEAEIQQMSPEV